MILPKGPSPECGPTADLPAYRVRQQSADSPQPKASAARVDCQGAGVLLNFEEVSIRALVEMGLLKPAGNAKGNERKYFCTKTILKLTEDEKWIGDATRAVSRYWSKRMSGERC